MKIPEPKYKVSRDEDHIYTIEYKGKSAVVPGTTGMLEIVGSKDKTNRLMGWAKKHALLKVAEHIRAFAGKPLTVDEAWIEAVRKSAWKRDKDLLKAAGDIGTAVHLCIDRFIDGKDPETDEKTKPGFDNFTAWLNGSGIKLIKGDTFVGSLEHHYGGALDAIGEKDGKLILLDWKTSNYLNDTYSLQAAGYATAFEETYGLKIDRAFVCRFGKEVPEDNEIREVNIIAAWIAFDRALHLSDAMTAPLWAPAAVAVEAEDIP
jgi:hypothetical protein